MERIIIKALTPVLVIITSLIIVFSNIESNGKEQLLLALISGFFGNSVPSPEEIINKYNSKLDKDRERLL